MTMCSGAYEPVPAIRTPAIDPIRPRVASVDDSFGDGSPADAAATELGDSPELEVGGVWHCDVNSDILAFQAKLISRSGCNQITLIEEKRFKTAVIIARSCQSR